MKNGIAEGVASDPHDTNCHKCYPFRKYPTNEDILDPAFIRTSVLYTRVFEENNVLCGITLNQVILSHVCKLSELFHMKFRFLITFLTKNAKFAKLY